MFPRHYDALYDHDCKNKQSGADEVNERFLGEDTDPAVECSCHQVDARCDVFEYCHDGSFLREPFPRHPTKLVCCYKHKDFACFSE